MILLQNRMYRHIVNTCTVPQAATVLGVMVTTENNVKKLKFCRWLLYIFFFSFAGHETTLYDLPLSIALIHYGHLA